MSIDLVLDQYLSTLHQIYIQSNNPLDPIQFPEPLNCIDTDQLQKYNQQCVKYDIQLYQLIGTINTQLQSEYYQLPPDSNTPYLSQSTQSVIQLIELISIINNQCTQEYYDTTLMQVTNELQAILQRVVNYVCGHIKPDITVQCIVYSDLSNISDKLIAHKLDQSLLYKYIQEQLLHIAKAISHAADDWISNQWSTVLKQTKYKFIMNSMRRRSCDAWYIGKMSSDDSPLLNILQSYIMAMSDRYKSQLHSSISSTVLPCLCSTILHSYIQYIIQSQQPINLNGALQLRYDIDCCIALTSHYSNQFKQSYTQYTNKVSFDEFNCNINNLYIKLMIDHIQYCCCIVYILLHSQQFQSDVVSTVSCLSSSTNNTRIVPMPRLDVIQHIKLIINQTTINNILQCISNTHNDKFDSKQQRDSLY